MKTALTDTSRAFDTHAYNYDALVEPNALLQGMREVLWAEVARRVAPPARLLDIGCGTGIDAEHFARQGYRVTAVDSSREMVHHTRQRVTRTNLSGQVRVEHIGAEALERLRETTFDAAYSDLGPLNCLADLCAVSKGCAARLKPGGYLIVSVMARICPWEIGYFTLRGDFGQAERRFPRTLVPVKLEDGIVWTRYYSPREFYSQFEGEFRLVSYRALNLLLPPPYLIHLYRRAGGLTKPVSWLDARASSLPVLKNMGDHFLMVLQKAESAS